MKKILKLSLFTLISLLTFVSCGSDKDEPNDTSKQIQGVWQRTDLNDLIEAYEGTISQVKEYIYFETDGNYIKITETVWTEEMAERLGSRNKIEIENGTFKTLSNQVSLYASNGSFNVYNFNIVNNRLNLSSTNGLTVYSYNKVSETSITPYLTKQGILFN